MEKDVHFFTVFSVIPSSPSHGYKLPSRDDVGIADVKDLKNDTQVFVLEDQTSLLTSLQVNSPEVNVAEYFEDMLDQGISVVGRLVELGGKGYLAVAVG